MRPDLPMVRRVVLAAVTAPALVFGAQQALAAPPQGDDARACTECRRQCPEFGGQIVRGQCACCG